jgi:formyltetrahydrofolate deformylase
MQGLASAGGSAIQRRPPRQSARDGASSMTEQIVLRLSCKDVPGIVADVAGFMAGQGLNIVESGQFYDRDTGRFFMRMVVDPLEGAVDLAGLRRSFQPHAERWGMSWEMHDSRHRLRTLVMVSRFDHCLNDLLYRYGIGGLPVEIPAVVSNHMESYRRVAAMGIPYHHWPVTPASKAAQERKLLELVEEQGIELVVLARYMQVLSPELCARMAGRIINIHHSFLPSFKGAKPYHQAHARGVKLIGATAHYVTDALDEGPIIEQDVARVDHAMTPDELVAIGRDVENVVLARAVRWHAEQRVMLNGQKTVVFR